MLVLPTRSQRRAESRDDARKHPHHPKPSQYGRVAEIVHGRTRLPEARIGTTSGQRRIDAKRNARGEFWRTVAIRVSVDMEPYFRASLHLLGHGTRIVSRTRVVNWLAYEFDVHIPGAPATAVRAEPVWWSEYDERGHHTIRLHRVNYADANGQGIEDAEQLAEVAS